LQKPLAIRERENIEAPLNTMKSISLVVNPHTMITSSPELDESGLGIQLLETYIERKK
jgi:hypothetical protein